jgi:hypothetical protein
MSDAECRVRELEAALRELIAALDGMNAQRIHAAIDEAGAALAESAGGEASAPRPPHKHKFFPKMDGSGRCVCGAVRPAGGSAGGGEPSAPHNDDDDPLNDCPICRGGEGLACSSHFM